MVANLAEAQSHQISAEAFLACDTEILSAKREKDGVSFNLAGAKKAAKKIGMNLTSYSLLEKIRRLDDDEQIVVLRAFWQMTQWLEMPVGTQFSLIDAPKMPKPTPAVKAAKSEHDHKAAWEVGLKAGRSGDPADVNPHKAGSEKHAGWAKGHTEGLGERAVAARMGSTENERPTDTADATRKAGQGRGRKGSASRGQGDILAAGRDHLNGGAVTAH